MKNYKFLAISHNLYYDIMQEIIPGSEMIPEKMVERQLVKQGVVKLLNTLNKREEEIVILYFGLNGENLTDSWHCIVKIANKFTCR
jgi:DNA-directed RNA polymerase sigma subunit (sigma70/sigma32)